MDKSFKTRAATRKEGKFAPPYFKGKSIKKMEEGEKEGGREGGKGRGNVPSTDTHLSC